MRPEIDIVIAPRLSDLGGGLKVRRALPYQKKKLVGPFIFLDHMGPVDLAPGKEIKVRSHPHIGLSTLTYLFSGELLHRDTLGTEQMIKPREVNWMTAGSGIAHSETARDDDSSQVLEGLQAWIALPLEHEDTAPTFTHKNASEIPVINIGENEWTIVAGTAFGKTSPVPVFSPLFYLVTEAQQKGEFLLEIDETSEGGVYVSKGSVRVNETAYSEGELVVFKQGTPVSFSFEKGSRLAVVGGQVFPEKRFIWWNFVASSQEKIEAAKLRWKNGDFGTVIHETEEIPLPLT